MTNTRRAAGVVRRQSLKLIAIGVVVGVAWVAVLSLLQRDGFIVWGPGIGAPGLPFMVGLTQLITGRRFDELARSWDALQGWQRGILGLVIVAMAVLVMMVLAGIVIEVSM